MAIVTPLPVPCTASQVVVQVGQEISPAEETAGSGAKAKVPSVSALTGWAISESAGAIAKVRLWDGNKASTRLLATIPLAALGSSFIALPDSAAITSGAIFLEVVSGSVEGSVRWSE